MPYIPIDKPVEEILVDLINTANTTTFTPEQLTFGAPVADPGDDPEGTRNTKVVATAVPGSGYAGNRDLWYNRLYAESFFSQASLDAGKDGIIRIPPATVGAGITLFDAVAYLETSYGIVIDKTDLNAVDAVQPINGELTFTMPSSSLMWVAGTFQALVEDEGTDVSNILPDQMEDIEDPAPVV